MSPTPANSAELRWAQLLDQALIELNRAPSEEMMSEDAKFALGF
jgi:hypothetical protein